MKRILLLLAAVCVLPGCGDDEPATENASVGQAGFETPEAAFEAFQKAGTSGDYSGMVDCLTPESQEAMVVMIALPLGFMAAFDSEKEEAVKKLFAKHGVSPDDEDPDAIKQIPDKGAFIADCMKWLDENSDEESMTPLGMGELGKVTITGNTASASLTTEDGSTDDVDFQKINNRWFVKLDMEPKLSTIETTGDPDFGTDFNTGNFSDFSFEEVPDVPLEAVSLDQFNSAWQVTMQADGKPASEVLTELAKGLDLEIQAPESLSESLAKPVSLNLEKRSRLEAVEEVCRQIELRPSYSKKTLKLEAGARTQPVVFSGPFLIEVAELATKTDSATGQLTLKAFASGLPPVILQQLNENSSSEYKIEKVAEAGGSEIQHRNGSGAMSMQNGPVPFEREMFVGLKNLLRNVTALSQVEGHIEISLPTSVEVVKFDDLKKGAEKKTGDTTLTLSQVNGKDFTFQCKGLPDDSSMQVTAVDADGKDVGEFASSRFGVGGSVTLSRSYKSAPAVIELRLVTASESLNFPFSFSDIAIPNHAQMPEKLAELSFDGDAPVTLEFLEFTGQEEFKKLKFRLTNHSNKEASTLYLNFDYLDGAGKKLKDHTTNFGGVMPAGEEKEIEVAAFFMPEETKSVKTMIKQGGFSDATKWKP